MPASQDSMLKTLFQAVLLVGIGVALTLVLGYAGVGNAHNTIITSAGPTVTQVKELSELVVYRCQIADVIKGESLAARAAILVRGDCDLAIDLNLAQVQDVNPEHRTARIVLPLPKVCRPRVDHERTTVYSIDRTSYNPFVDDRGRLLEQSMQEAQKLIEKAASSPDFVKAAQHHAEASIQAFYRALGWTVSIEWVS
jgi:hypothetical protein